MQQRYYDPVIGRFYSNDPVDTVAHLHGPNGTYGFTRYAYANNNPYKYVDPDGRCSTGSRIKGAEVSGCKLMLGFDDTAAPAKLKQPPVAPSGMSIDYNIKIAEDVNFNPQWFKNQVKNGGPWDYKQNSSDYENFGNFHYGAVGSAHGFPNIILLNEAGIAQSAAGTSLTGWGEPGPRFAPWLGTGSNGDDPNDQYWIKQGIDYYENRSSWWPPVQGN